MTVSSNPLRRPLRIAAILLLAAAAVWRGWLAERWTPRLTRDWHQSGTYVGTETFADPRTGTLPDRDVVGEYERALRVVADSGPRGLLLEDRNTIVDVASGKKQWEYTTRALVDPRTGAHLDPRYRGDIAIFPREVERRTYRLRANYMKGVPLAFQREEVIDGLRTYLFAYRGAAEYTESFAGTAATPGVPVRAGEEIRCADDQFYYRLWVEPHTGAAVKLEEGCPSGDYVFDAATGVRRAAVDRWSGATLGQDLIAQVADVRRQRNAYLVTVLYLPAALALLGVVLLGLSLRAQPPAVA